MDKVEWVLSSHFLCLLSVVQRVFTAVLDLYLYQLQSMSIKIQTKHKGKMAVFGVYIINILSYEYHCEGHC